MDLDVEPVNMKPSIDTIVDYIPAPTGDPEAPTQILIKYNRLQRIRLDGWASLVLKVDNGVIKVNQDAVIVNEHEPDKFKRVKVSKLYEFEGLNKEKWKNKNRFYRCNLWYCRYPYR